jgi:hypothetical protein
VCEYRFALFHKRIHALFLIGGRKQGMKEAALKMHAIR